MVDLKKGPMGLNPLSFVNLKITQRLWIAYISFVESLQLSINLVVSLLLLIIILRACWAPSVKLSASSNIIIFVRPASRFTFFWANVLISSLTTSIPL